MHKRYPSTIIVVLAAIVLLGASVTAESDRESLYGFAAPYVLLQPRFVGEGNPPILQQETTIAIDLDIDAAGEVTNVTMDSSAHERLAKYIGPHLKQLQFAPALFQGKNVPSKLPIEVFLWPGDYWPTFVFPMDTLGQLNNRQLYDRCLELNGITPPRVVRFESYFATPYVDTTSGPYRYVLLAIDLDSSGAVLERRKLLSTFPVYDDQVRAAVLWSEFGPVVVKGRSIPSTLYLMVSFFGAVAYPTPHWPPDPDSVSNPLEFLRLRSFGDRTGLMSPPVPKILPSDIYPLGPDRPARRDTVSVRLQIDTLGRCRFINTEKTHQEIRRAIAKMASKIKFSPALDFNGRPQSYSGRAIFEFNGTTNVRIRWTWLR